MSVVIPDEVLQASHLSEGEFKAEIAVMMFQKEWLSLAQASRLAGMSILGFQRHLADRDVSVHYDVDEFEADLKTLRELGRL